MTIAQELVSNYKKETAKWKSYGEMFTEDPLSWSEEMCLLKSQASIYARALNEELKCKHMDLPIILINDRISFIESELKLLREAKLIQ